MQDACGAWSSSPHPKGHLVSKQLDTLGVEPVDPDRIEAVTKDMPDESIFQCLAQIFRVLADPSRVKIIYALLVTELSVGDLAQTVGSSVSATSHCFEA